MAILYEDPTNLPEAASAGYQRQNTLIYADRQGLMQAALTNMATTDVPMMMEGSQFELNGKKCKCSANEAITGSPETGRCFVYAVPNATGATFAYGSAVPAWDGNKCGWYSGNNRALAKLFYTEAGQYNGKVILDSYNAMQMINTEQPLPATGGVLVAWGATNAETLYDAEPGAYCIELKGGLGGNGGNSYERLGGAGADGEPTTKTLLLLEKKQLWISTGGDGNNGESNDYIGGGGGGGCTGGASYAREGNSFISVAAGGSGGGGASNDQPGRQYYGGGGGGGGYGVGGNGASIVGYGGYGGHDFVGGDGNGLNGGGGGGGSAYTTGGAGNNGGANGGSYGEPGGGGGSGHNDGGIWSSIPNTGGLSAKLFFAEGWCLGPRNAYQGGGGGGGGALGGSGLQSISSGYAFIYKLW